ncbi:FecR family protein [Daejeonella sp.]|uniref:FecR family protein n=1 Tax=Daejeonella sp. TaxID=2805397 RepID=UPI002730BE9A|nr:FecR family protein [Daejeonella sp.]MDP2413518.1 FecR family protein [Daejeonella sp.]
MKPLSSNERYQELAEKWLNNTISPQESEEFLQWYNSGQENDIYIPRDYAESDQELKRRIFAEINHNISEPILSPSYRIQSWFAAAAVIIAVFAAGLYFSSETKETKQYVADKLISEPTTASPIRGVSPVSEVEDQKPVVVIDIEAGENKAILTLGDGSKIILDDAKNGILANQGGNSVLKAAEGEVIYSFLSEVKDPLTVDEHTPVIYNTIETPKGGKFQIKLPDGSKVWLNAASSLRFPTVFNGSKRQVELKGEAYFEVSPDKSKIFEVNTRNQVVQVLGTHFNINAYLDEPTVNTTLLEGSVRVSDLRTNISQLLKPGEQSQLSEQIEVINLKNTNEAVAWKEGYFQFDDADIKTVMRQIERWYDVSVVYEGDVPNYRFGGEIERNLSLLQVLKVLEKTKVHFRLEGREVIVMR